MFEHIFFGDVELGSRQMTSTTLQSTIRLSRMVLQALIAFNKAN